MPSPSRIVKHYCPACGDLADRLRYADDFGCRTCGWTGTSRNVEKADSSPDVLRAVARNISYDRIRPFTHAESRLRGKHLLVAADEIERLEAENAALKEIAEAACDIISDESFTAKRRRLRDAVFNLKKAQGK